MLLLQVLGLVTLRFFSTLMPLLLDWCHNLDEATQLKALEALQEVIKHTWPRMPAHASFLWSHLQGVCADIQADSTELRLAGQAVDPQNDIKDCLACIAEMLYLCGGLHFQQMLHDHSQSSDRVNDLMLQAVCNYKAQNAAVSCETDAFGQDTVKTQVHVQPV